ncbi:FMN-dependent dehydrogenase-domain-containing protein [Mycena pura]|uniref:FMN-dependent dehydrogenase-domain-containing protein n=1 Tax=Mycena pura TaxID=153505 RepID=A0AAD6YJ70_9AGAR|nr:FMN-dependent dehydrogenase-domain-containing protein [Mycena pura]
MHGIGVQVGTPDPVFMARLGHQPIVDANKMPKWPYISADMDARFRAGDADDAEAALAHGADGIIVSNHGGRQLVGALPSLYALAAIMHSPAIRAAQATGRLTVFDSGVRTGPDILKAIALGAQAIIRARPGPKASTRQIKGGSGEDEGRCASRGAETARRAAMAHRASWVVQGDDDTYAVPGVLAGAGPRAQGGLLCAPPASGRAPRTHACSRSRGDRRGTSLRCVARRIASALASPHHYYRPWYASAPAVLCAHSDGCTHGRVASRVGKARGREYGACAYKADAASTRRRQPPALPRSFAGVRLAPLLKVNNPPTLPLGTVGATGWPIVRKVRIHLPPMYPLQARRCGYLTFYLFFQLARILYGITAPESSAGPQLTPEARRCKCLVHQHPHRSTPPRSALFEAVGLARLGPAAETSGSSLGQEGMV